MSDPRERSFQTMTELLATYQAWSERESLEFARRHADAAGEPERAGDVQQIIERDDETGSPPPAALDALAAQHELAERLAGWRWHTVCDARENGASWSEIASSIRSTPRETRIEYLGYVEGARQIAERYGTGFDVDRYRAAAGDWTNELHPDTPPEAVEQIEQALATDDTDTLAALQRVWWDPSRSVHDAVTEAPTDRAEAAAADTSAATSTDPDQNDDDAAGRAAPPDPWAPDPGEQTGDTQPAWAWSSDGVMPVPRWDQAGHFEVYDPATGVVHRDISEERYFQLAEERSAATTSEPVETGRDMERAAAGLDADYVAGTEWGHEDRVLAEHHADQAASDGSADRPLVIGRVPAPRTALGEVLDRTPAVELLARAEHADNVTYTGDLAAKEWAYRELEAVEGEAQRRAAITGIASDRALADYVELLCEDPGVERFAEYTDLHRSVHHALGVDSVPPDTDPDSDTATATAGDGVPVAVAVPAGEHDRRPGETRDELAAARAARGDGLHEHDAQLGRGEWGLSDHDRDRLVDALDPAGAAERERLREAIDPATSQERFAQIEAAALAAPSEPASRPPGTPREVNAGLERLAAWQRPTAGDEEWFARVTELMGEPDPVADAADVAVRIERAEGPDSPAARAAWAEHGRRLDAATADPRWELGEDAASWSATDTESDDSRDDGLMVGSIVLPGGLPPEHTADEDGDDANDANGGRAADAVWTQHRSPSGGLAEWDEFDHGTDLPDAAPDDGPDERTEPAAPPKPDHGARSTGPFWNAEDDAWFAHLARARAANPSYDPSDQPSRPDDLTHLRERLDGARAAVADRDTAQADARGGADPDADAEDDPAACQHSQHQYDADDAAADIEHDDTADGED